MSEGAVHARTALTALCIKLGEVETAQALGVRISQVLAWTDDISGIDPDALLRLEELTYVHTTLSDLGYPDADIRAWFRDSALPSGSPLELVARGGYADAEQLRVALIKIEKRVSAAETIGRPLPPLNA
jgi:hypothetical protein